MDENVEIAAFTMCVAVSLCLLMSCMDWIDGVYQRERIAMGPPLYWHIPKRL